MNESTNVSWLGSSFTAWFFSSWQTHCSRITSGRRDSPSMTSIQFIFVCICTVSAIRSKFSASSGVSSFSHQSTDSADLVASPVILQTPLFVSWSAVHSTTTVKNIQQKEPRSIFLPRRCYGAQLRHPVSSLYSALLVLSVTDKNCWPPVVIWFQPRPNLDVDELKIRAPDPGEPSLPATSIGRMTSKGSRNPPSVLRPGLSRA